jgi:hypothetical protein
MNTVKSIAIIAALERHIARNGAKRPTTGGQPPAPAAAPPGPGVIPHDAPRPQATGPSPNLQSAVPPAGTTAGTRTATRHHKNMYMSAKGNRLSAKGSVVYVSEGQYA